jgi:mannose-6-phosphate isomerase-like protein (cupin superfamily)
VRTPNKVFHARIACSAVLLSAAAGVALAQNSSTAAEPPLQTSPDVLQLPQLAARAKALLAQARKENGSVSLTLSRYPGHYTMLSARTTSGGGEVHTRVSDFLIVIDGEGTELTGGTMVDPKPGDNGEIRGTRLEGATPHVLHKGDVIHIPAGTPHQAIVAPGQSITLFVIKVEDPAAASTSAH